MLPSPSIKDPMDRVEYHKDIFGCWILKRAFDGFIVTRKFATQCFECTNVNSCAIILTTFLD
jgi:hypothetical protein